MADACWGKFQESGLSQDITLGITCRRQPGFFADPLKSNVHSGSTIAAFDEEADGDYEVLLGDLLYDGLTYLRNGGTATAAYMDTTYGLFPIYDASVDINIFVAAYFLDVNNDNKKDMIAAPNSLNVSVNYDNCWYYENVDPGNGVTLSRVKKTFLIDQMIDVGMGAYPVLFDHNNDGLLDLVIGNYSKKVSASNINSGLVLYENIGTANAPEFSLVDRNYAGLHTAFNPAAFGITPTFGDLDGDGDKDLMVGASDGKLHYFENTAAMGQPASFGNLQAEYKGIDVGQFAAPVLVDIDRDGKLDLVVGEMGGTLRYYHNIGTAQVADFASSPDDNKWGFVDTQPVCCTGFAIPFIFENNANNRYDLLVGSESGKVMYYADIESQIGDTFQLTQARFGDINEGQRTAIAGADLNNDGTWDWVVGNVRGGVGFYSGNGPVITSVNPADAHSFDWEVFPNPSNGNIAVRLNDNLSGNFELKVYDLAGREVFATQQLNAAVPAHLDFGTLQNGTYLLELKVNGAFGGVKRIVIAQ